MPRRPPQNLRLLILASLALGAGCGSDPAPESPDSSAIDALVGPDSSPALDAGAEPAQGDASLDDSIMAPDAAPDAIGPTPDTVMGDVISPDDAVDAGTTDLGEEGTEEDAEEDASSNPELPDVEDDTATPQDIEEDSGPVVTEGPAPVLGDLVITEIMFDPTGLSDSNAEWLEVVNTTDHAVSLAACQLHDMGSDMVSLALSEGTTLIPAGAYWLLASNGAAELNGGLAADLVYGDVFLANTADEVMLTCAGLVIDSVAYDNTSWPMGSGRALSLGGGVPPDEAANDDPSAWCRASTLYTVDNYGTPGAPNPVCLEPDGSVDACRLVSPVSAELFVGAPFVAAAVVYDEGITDINSWVDAHPDLSAEIGVGPVTADPNLESELFVWTAALGATNWTDTESPDWDRYELTLDAPASGNYQVLARFSLDDGATWLNCDLTGSEDGYSTGDAGLVTTGLDPCDPNPCTTPPAITCSDDGLNVVTAMAPGLCAIDGLSSECTYETEDTSCSVLGGTCDNGACVNTAATPTVGDLVFTEIMPNPAGIPDNQGEWFELVVVAAEPLNLEGCVLSSGTSEAHTIMNGGGFLAAPGDVLLFTRSADAELNGGLLADYTYTSLNLGNVGDSVAIHCADVQIDTVIWSAELGFPLGAGEAFQLNTDAYDGDANDEGGAWCVALAPYAEGNLGSPGLPNPPCPVPDLCEGVVCSQPPPSACILGVATTYVDTGGCIDGVCTYAEASMDDCAAAGVLCDDGACLDAPDPCLPNLCLTSAPAVCEGDMARSSASVGSCSADVESGEAVCEFAPLDLDCAALGTVCLDGACVGIDTTPTEGSVIFNEFLLAPTKSPQGLGTWLEVMNASAGWVDLSGCVLEASGGSATTLSPGAPIWLAPGATSLMAASATPTQNGGLQPDIVLPTSFALPSEAATLSLTCQEVLIDAVTYAMTPWGGQSGLAWQLDPESTDASANDASSAWCFAIAPYGKGDFGSPGSANPLCPAINGADWCRIEAPLLADVIVLGDEVIASGALRELPFTSLSAGTDPHPAIRMQFIAGPQGADPAADLSEWALIDGTPASAWSGQGDQSDVDKYNATWTPESAEDLSLAMRVTVDQGRTWTYCDRDTGVEGQDGSEDGFTIDHMIALTVAPSPCDPNPCTDAPIATCEGEVLTEYTATGTCTLQGMQALCDYAASVLDCSLYAAHCIEGACDGMPNTPAPGDVVITEMMIAPESATDDGGEWFELLNAAAEPLILNGCVLSDPSGSDTHTVDPSTPFVLQPGELVVFGRTGNPSANGGTPVDYFYGQTFTLDNDTDGVILTCAGAVVDSVIYDALFPTATGASLQLPPGAQDTSTNDDASAWCPSYTPFGDGDQGTPGAPNLACPTPTPLDWCRLQAPESILEVVGTEVMVYGHVYQAGVTDASSAVDTAPLLIAQLAFGPDGTDPSADDEGWSYVSAAANAAWNDAFEPGNDEYQAVLVTPAPGEYDYAFRFSADGGLSWTWCDLPQGTPETDGSVDGYQVAASGALYASEGPCDPNPCIDAAAAVCSDDQLITEVAPGACTPLAEGYECDFVQELTDCAALGGTCAEGACSDIGLPPVDGDIVFTELMPNPDEVSDADGEWVELKNVSGHKLDLAGCHFDSGTSSSEVPGPHYILDSGAYFVIARSMDPAVNGGISSDAGFSFPLTNNGQVLTFACADLVIDSVSYDEDSPASAGIAMQLDPGSSNADDNDLAYSWCEATSSVSALNADLGSPGLENTPCPEVDPCVVTTCDAPPEPSCDGDMLWQPTGESTCMEGVCDYPAVPVDCSETDQVCAQGACTTPTNAVDWCRLQWPLVVEAYPGEMTVVYGRYFEAGLTDSTAGVDPSALIEAVIAFGPPGSDPTQDDTEWSLVFPAEANPGWADTEPGVDEVWAEVPTPATGDYDYAMRITVDGGASWTWCDTAPSIESNGSEDGYQIAHAGQWYSLSDPCDVTTCDAPPDSACVDEVLYTYTEPGTCALTEGVPQCSYPEAVLDCASSGQTCGDGLCVDSPSVPLPGAIQLTEMMLEPTMAIADSGRWVEYTNTTTELLTLDDCVVQSGETSAVLDGLVSPLSASQRFVVGDHADASVNGGYEPDVVLSTLALSTANHTIALMCAGQVIDTVTFDPEVWSFSLGASLQLGAEHSEEDNTLAAHWCSAVTPYGDGDLGSPGGANDVCVP
jgi:hypothetical protein